jgi:SAM-dependent methyltransferase
MSFIKNLLSHPLTRSLSVDDPRTTELRHKIIQEKIFLKKLYTEWYLILLRDLNESHKVLELGSGAGFIKSLLPTVLTSEVIPTKNIDLVVDAINLPFSNNSLDAIVMTDVLHHIPTPSNFFKEASRVLKKNGEILLIEPWPSHWSELIYAKFHHEPFDKKAGWTIPPSGPLSGANGAIPWILFERDKEAYEKQFPELRINKIEKIMPFSYLLSGGVSLRYSCPGFLYKYVRSLESMISQDRWAMFAFIQIKRI